jgi:tetratricopeptide (TPR) repeat protein
MSIHMEGFTDDRGELRFSNVPSGDYVMEVSGEIEGNVVVQRFNIPMGDYLHSESVKVKSKLSDSEKNKDAGATISAAELAVPEPARIEMEKGLVDFQKKKYAAAKKHFIRALDKYTKYVSAMNNLGALALSEKDAPTAIRWFEQAIQMDPGFPDPYFNLARIAQTKEDHRAVEQYLLKFAAIKPRNVPALVMLAEAQMYNGHFEDAIANAHKVHYMDHRQYSEVHVIAARAFERNHQPSEAMAEYHVYLHESPEGSLVARVNRTLSLMAEQYGISSDLIP